jgi:hypothetical protein
MRTGNIPTVAGFQVLVSNNLENDGTNWYVLAGTREAISFAGQVSETTAYRPEKRFADAIKGLYVYGRKVIQPNCLASIYVAQA